MALDFETTYAPRANAADANYPFGSAKNDGVPGDKTGSPLDKDWLNDFLGFFQKLLNDASITPSGVSDTILASDYFDGLNTAIDERTGIGSGTKMAFFQAAAPTGWTQDTSHNDKALRVVSGVGGGNGGSLAFSSATVGGHTLITSEIPVHTHIQRVKVTGDQGNSGTQGANFANDDNGGSTAATGGGGSHDHPLALAYIDVIIATKD